MSTYRVTIGIAKMVSTNFEFEETFSQKEFLDQPSAWKWVTGLRAGFTNIGGGWAVPSSWFEIHQKIDADTHSCLVAQLVEVPAARPTPKGDVVLPSMG